MSMTDERIRELWTHHGQVGTDYRGWCRTFARAVEAEARREALEAAAKVCEPIICGSQGFAGPSCCVAEHGHEGPHRYGEPRPMTARECAATIRALKEGKG